MQKKTASPDKAPKQTEPQPSPERGYNPSVAPVEDDAFARRAGEIIARAVEADHAAKANPKKRR